MINITNKIARRLYLAEFIRQMTTLENTQTREFKPVLNRQYMNAARLVQQGVTDGVDHAVDHERDRLVALMARHYRRVATVFGNKTFKIIENSKSVYVSEIKGLKDEFWAELNQWTRVQAGSKITKVQGTTKKLIAKVIRRGMQEGESHLEIAKRIRKTGRIATAHKARTIALTETHTAACKSVDVAIKSTRIEMEKEWLATIDKRTRPDHVAMASHPRVPEGGKFKVGINMVPMEYPGDPAGGADQTVRCRCVLLYHTVKRMDRLKPYEPEPGFVPAKNLSELDEKMQNMKLGGFEFDKKYSKGDALNIGNQVIGHMHDVFTRFPGLRKVLDEQQLFTIEVVKARTLPSMTGGAAGRYVRSSFRIELAGSTRKVHSLAGFGKSNFAMNKDLFSITRHEFGHHVFAKAKKDKFRALWKDKGKSYFEKHVTKYSGKNSEEAFCEVLSGYTSPLYGSTKKKTFPKELEEAIREALDAFNS